MSPLTGKYWQHSQWLNKLESVLDHVCSFIVIYLKKNNQESAWMDSCRRNGKEASSSGSPTFPSGVPGWPSAWTPIPLHTVPHDEDFVSELMIIVRNTGRLLFISRTLSPLVCGMKRRRAVLRTLLKTHRTLPHLTDTYYLSNLNVRTPFAISRLFGMD